MQDSDILLIISDRKEAVTLKVFEYMAVERPILALTPPDSALARIIKETHSGIVVPPHNARAIAHKLYKLIRDARVWMGLGSVASGGARNWTW